MAKSTRRRIEEEAVCRRAQGAGAQARAGDDAGRQSSVRQSGCEAQTRREAQVRCQVCAKRKSVARPTLSPSLARQIRKGKWVYGFGDGKAEGQSRHARPARRQGRGPRRDGQSRPAGAARLHHHHRGLHALLRQRQHVSGGPRAAGEVPRSTRSAASPARRSATRRTRCSCRCAPARAPRCRA